MADDANELLRVICDIPELRELRVTFRHTLVSGVGIGSTAIAAGLIFGPAGLFIGAAVSGLTAFLVTEGNFKSVPEIINGMSDEQKTRLVSAIKNVLWKENILAIADFARRVAIPGDFIIGLIIPVVEEFLKHDLKATIKQ